jgi:hypothetical protein
MKVKKKALFLLLGGCVVAVIFILRLVDMGYAPHQVLPSAAVLLVFLLLVPLLRDIAPLKTSSSDPGVTPPKKGLLLIRFAGTYLLAPLLVGLIYFLLPPPALSLPTDILLLLAVSLIVVFFLTGTGRG